ncbi:MAG: LPS sulfotransferase NodH [Bacteroidia bacterium]|jgi:LPS sulfotransferase NodH
MTITLNKYVSVITKKNREADFLLEKLIGWRKNQRFLIVSRSRSGSNMFCSFLESNPDCFIWREVFQRPQYFSSSITRFLIHGKYLRKFKIVSFKVFYYHTVPENFWEQTMANDNVRIIHLVRNNRLGTYVSQREAMANAKWEAFKGNGKQRSQTKLKVDTDDLQSFLRRNETMINGMKNRLQGRRNVLQLSYEELVDGSGMGKVSNFLQDVLNPKNYGMPKNKKQSVGFVSDKIETIDEVEVTLRKFGWEHFNTNE